jgi:Kef-type K+ transport system membrane component KefB
MSLLNVELFNDLKYLILIILLFIVPRWLTRYRLPMGITAFFLGVGVHLGFGTFENDETIRLLATLGIITLFFSAGLDVEIEEIKTHARVIVEHLIVRLLLIFVVTVAVIYGLKLSVRASCLLSIALLTPSAGFIIDALDQSGLSGDNKFWVKTKAIVAEFAALFVMFVVLQSTSWLKLLISMGVMSIVVVVVPLFFRQVAIKMSRYAPNSEFGCFVLAAIVCGHLTMKLGGYYLIGAFIVGVAARQFKENRNDAFFEKFTNSLGLFLMFFVPFYFFKTGLGLDKQDLGLWPLVYGLIFAITLVPIRVFSIAIHRHLSLGEEYANALQIGVSLLPNLVFGLVIAEMLRDIFHVPQPIFGGLVIYTLSVSMIPNLIPLFQSKHKKQINHSQP